MVCRLAWGMRGSWFAVFFRVMPAVVWDGIEAWWGAQAISTMIGTWSIRWANWEHPLANGTMELKDFIGFIIYHFIFLGVMWLPPEKLHRPFHVSFVGFTMVIIGLVIWSTHTAGGGGQYFAGDYKPPSVLAGSIGKMPPPEEHAEYRAWIDIVQDGLPYTVLPRSWEIRQL